MAKSDKGGGDLGNALSMGMYLVAGAVMGLVIGTWLGAKFGSESGGQVIGLFAGTAAGIYLVIKEALKANKD